MGGIGQATRDWAAKWPSRYCPLTGSRMPTAVHRDLKPANVIVGTDGTVKNCWLESGELADVVRSRRNARRGRCCAGSPIRWLQELFCQYRRIAR
jgi:hypothetical protein